jgi:fluoride exporter
MEFTVTAVLFRTGQMMTPGGETCWESYPGAIPAKPVNGLLTEQCVSAHAVVMLRQSHGGRLQKYLLIALGGALGSIARYWVGATIVNRLGTRFPWGTLVINLTACVVIGFSMTFLARRTGLSAAWRYLVPVGFVGAYSTFSTYEWETLSLMRSGTFALATIYAFGSLVLGLAATWCGMMAADFLS